MSFGKDQKPKICGIISNLAHRIIRHPRGISCDLLASTMSPQLTKHCMDWMMRLSRLRWDSFLRNHTIAPPTFPLGLQNLATAFREATKSKIVIDSEKDLDSLILLGQGTSTEGEAAFTTNQIKTELNNPRGSNRVLEQPS